MSPFKTLRLALTAYACAVAAQQHLSNPYDACEVTIDRFRYDLCPLFHDRGQDGVVRVRAELSPNTQTYYEISFGVPLSTQNGEEIERQCPPGTWVCLRGRQVQFEDSGSYFAQATSIVGDFVIGTPRIASSRPQVDAYHSTHSGELEIDPKEGIRRNEPRAAHFRFICDQHANEPSLPKFIGITAGIHNFEWSTPHACAKEPLGFNTLGENEDATLPAGDALPGGNQELVDSLPVHTVRNLMIAFAVASFVILGLGYLIRYPPPQVKRWVGLAAKKLPFRVGEGILVQWAEEAMFINDEEDVMVNYEEEDDSDEYIPLKPSPTRSSVQFMDYGSARR